MSDLEVLESLEKVEEIAVVNETKVKKPRTQKQIDAFEKARLIRQQNRDSRKETKLTLAEEQKIELDKKIVAKAIQLKKKQIKMQKMLVVEDEQDDDPVLERKPKAKTQQTIDVKPQATPKVVFNYI